MCYELLNCNVPKGTISTSREKSSKIIKKWLSLGPWVPSQKSNVPNFTFYDFFFTNWTNLSDLEQKKSKNFNRWPFLVIVGPRWKMYLLNRIFWGPEIFRDPSSQYYLPILRVSETSWVKKIFKKIISVKMHIMGPRWKMSHFNRIFFGPEVFRDGSSHYYLPFLRVLAKSLA